eukprot:s325_g25.t1
MKRGKDESLRGFWARWEEALRKVREHQVNLPDKFIGFLLIQALGLGDGEIKSLLSFTRGSILPNDVREWARKHEMKLMAKDVGVEKDRKATTSSRLSTGTYFVEDDNTEEINLMEDVLNELYSEDAEDYEAETNQIPEDEILDEHEVAEVLNTMIHRKKTYCPERQDQEGQGVGSRIRQLEEEPFRFIQQLWGIRPDVRYWSLEGWQLQDVN